MARQRIALGGLIPAGFEQITTNSTAASLNSTIRGAAHVLDISVFTDEVRYRADGTSPTATTGVILWAGTTYRFEGFNGTAAMKFVTAQSTAGVLDVQGWKFEE
jgi:hypothetical protein